jgi:hypothetical protein
MSPIGPEAAVHRDAAIRPQLEHKPTLHGYRECAAATLVTPRLTAATAQQPRQLGDVRGDAPGLVTNSVGALLIPVPISPPKVDGIEPFVRWGAARLGGLAMHGVMRALIARWVTLIAMLGLLALVIATSRIPCVPYGLWPTLQMHCR